MIWKLLGCMKINYRSRMACHERGLKRSWRRKSTLRCASLTQDQETLRCAMLTQDQDPSMRFTYSGSKDPSVHSVYSFGMLRTGQDHSTRPAFGCMKICCRSKMACHERGLKWNEGVSLSFDAFHLLRTIRLGPCIWARRKCYTFNGLPWARHWV